MLLLPWQWPLLYPVLNIGWLEVVCLTPSGPTGHLVSVGTTVVGTRARDAGPPELSGRRGCDSIFLCLPVSVAFKAKIPLWCLSNPNARVSRGQSSHLAEVSSHLKKM